MNGNFGNDVQWGGMMPPAPTANQGFKTSSAPVMPPLPPMSGLSIFDDSTTETPNSRDCDSMESKSDSESEAEIAPPTHPDDVLNGELLRTTDAMNSKTRSDSFYLVYNNRAKLIKVGVTLYTYEECSQKYTKLYGHLDNFHFLKIENDMTRERLERAFYQFFSETRLYTGKEFFQPFDARGRFMVPIYLSLLTKLTTSDLLSIRRFYLMHGTTALAAKQWIESQHQQGQQQQGQGQQQVEVDIPAEEARAFANVRILSTAATAQLAKAVELQNADTSSSSAGVYVNADAFYSSSDDEDTSPAAAPPVPATMQAAAVGNAHQQQAAAADLTDSDDAEEFAGSEDEEGPPVGDLQDRLLAASLAKSGSKSGSKSGKQSLSDKHDEALAPADQNVSVYLVHSARADLVKVGFTTGSYEECQKKYTTIYGSLDEFFFFAVENDLLMHRRSRLEKLFYRLFAKTRTTPGGPFFAPRDSLGRNMIPLYVTVLKALSAADTTHMTHFYRRNRVPSAMDDWVEQQHMLHSPGRGSLRAPSQQQQQPSPTLRLPAAALNFAYQNSAPPAVLIAKNSPTGGSLASAGRVSTAGAAAPASVPHSPAPPPPTGSFKASDLYVEDL